MLDLQKIAKDVRAAGLPVMRINGGDDVTDAEIVITPTISLQIPDYGPDCVIICWVDEEDGEYGIFQSKPYPRVTAAFMRVLRARVNLEKNNPAAK